MMKLLVITWSLLMIHILISGRSYGKSLLDPPEKHFDPNDCDQYRQPCINVDNVLHVSHVDRCGYHLVDWMCNIAYTPYCDTVMAVSPNGASVFDVNYRGRSCTDAYITDWRQRMLRRTNELRARHGAQPLHDDDNINAVAQQLAGLMPNSEKPRLDGCGGTALFFKSVMPSRSTQSFDRLPEHIVNHWYNQKKDYHYDMCNKRGEEFGAMVWKSSRRVGYGIVADSSCYKIYVAVCYSPIHGTPKQNVGPDRWTTHQPLNTPALPPDRWTTPRRLNTPAPHPNRWTTPRRLSTPAPPPAVKTTVLPQAAETTTPHPSGKTTAPPQVSYPETPDLGPQYEVVSADRGTV